MTWTTASLGDLCEINIGRTPARANAAYWTDGLHPWVSIADMSKSDQIQHTRERITDRGVAESGIKRVSPGTVLLSFKLSIGKVAIAKIPLFTNEAIASLPILNDRTLDAEYLLRSLQRINFDDVGNRAVMGRTLNKQTLAQIEIPLPPLNEQRRIAAILDKADAVRRKRRYALGLLESLTQSIFSRMFEGLVATSTISTMIKDNWLLLHKDGNHGSNYPRADEFGQDGVPFLSAKSVTDAGLVDETQVQFLRKTKADALKIGWIEPGDVLLAHNASVGKVALYRGEFDCALIGTSLTCFRPNPQYVLSEFLFGALRSQEFQAQLTKSMGQTTRNQVPITAQRELKLSIPPIQQQREFMSITSAQERLASKVRRELSSFDALFSSLQHRAFSGQL